MSEPTTERQRWMGVLARASLGELQDLLAQCAPLPGYTRLRGPELGLAMVRGRTGGGGPPFNLGEVTVCRCTIRTDDCIIGHAYVAGRDLRQAELAAVLDAALQDGARTDLHSELLAPLAEQQARRRDAIAGKAAATRVQFFTMTTMRE